MHHAQAVMGKGFGKSTAPGVDDTGWVCSSSTYLSMFIHLLFKFSLTTLVSLRQSGNVGFIVSRERFTAAILVRG